MKKLVFMGILIASTLRAAPSILINEVSRSGIVWVELRNISSEVINLNGWKLRNAHGEDALSGSVKPGGYIVICESREQLLSNYPSIHSPIFEVRDGQIGSGVDPNNDMLEIVAPDGTVVDMVNWGMPRSSWQFYTRDLWNPGIIIHSPVIARIPDALDRDMPDDFRGVSTGTPGEMNQVYNGLGTVSWGKIKAIFAGQKRR